MTTEGRGVAALVLKRGIMGIGKRFVRLMKADIHSILDCLEEPEEILKQAVRDMEETIDRTQAEIAAQRARLERVQSASAQNATALRELERQIELCFQTGSENLLKGFVRRKLEAGQRDRILARQQDDLGRTLAELAAKEREQQEKLASIREKIEIFCEGKCSDRESAEADPLFVSEEQVELAMRAEKAKRAHANAEEARGGV